MATLNDLVRTLSCFVDQDVLNLYGNKTAYIHGEGYIQLYFGSPLGKPDLRLLHRLVMQAKPHQIVDHIDRNRVNNIRSNLRIISTAGNASNRTKSTGKSSKHLGVSYRADRGKWRAYINYDDKYVHLGYFPTEQAAIDARQIAVDRLLKAVRSVI